MTMTRGRFVLGGLFAVALGFIAVTAIVFNFGGGDIEDNKTYALAYSYKATINGGTPARVFDLADHRNLSQTSIIVPLKDDHGMPLVRENPNLPPSTVRRVVAGVPTRKVDGVTYPGYTYVEWQYHLSTTEPQSVVPVVIPSVK